MEFDPSTIMTTSPKRDVRLITRIGGCPLDKIVVFRVGDGNNSSLVYTKKSPDDFLGVFVDKDANQYRIITVTKGIYETATFGMLGRQTKLWLVFYKRRRWKV